VAKNELRTLSTLVLELIALGHQLAVLRGLADAHSVSFCFVAISLLAMS